MTRRRSMWLVPLVAVFTLTMGAPAQAGQITIRTGIHANPAVVDLRPFTVYFPNLSAKLILIRGQREAPFPGATVDFIVRRLGTGFPVKVCSAVTNANGFASCGGVGVEFQVALGFGYVASYAGTNFFRPSSDRGRFVEVLG